MVSSYGLVESAPLIYTSTTLLLRAVIVSMSYGKCTAGDKEYNIFIHDDGAGIRPIIIALGIK